MYLEDKITVFLSHSHKDIEKVRKIRDILETLNCEPLTFFLKCLDDDNKELEDFIKKEIEARNVFVYCKSENAENSEWVQKELNHIRCFDEKRLYVIDLDKGFEYSLVSLLKDIIKIIYKNTIIIWRGKASEDVSLCIGNALKQHGYIIQYFEPDIKCEKSWNEIQLWEWPLLHDRYSVYIEEQVSDLTDKGVFVPILSSDLSDGGWNSFMSSKIINTLTKKSGICFFPLFLDMELDEKQYGDVGMNIHSANIEKEIPKIIEEIYNISTNFLVLT